jgi:hypothetical protein
MFPHTACRAPMTTSKRRLLTSISLAVVISCEARPTGPPRPSRAQKIDCSTDAAGSGLRYSAEFSPGTSKNPVDMLMVTFVGSKPTSGQAEGVVRVCIAAAKTSVRIDYEVLANAFFNDDGPLSLSDGSSSLTYDPKTAKVRTWNEREGIQPALTKGAGYTVEYEEHKIAVPPFTKIASMEILFQPALKQSGDVVRILKAELEKAVSKQPTKLDTTAYAKTGPADDRIAQKQIGPRGHYLSMEFDAKSGEIRDQDGRVLGTIKAGR